MVQQSKAIALCEKKMKKVIERRRKTGEAKALKEGDREVLKDNQKLQVDASGSSKIRGRQFSAVSGPEMEPSSWCPGDRWLAS